MPVNSSQTQEQKSWRKWKKAGAVGTMHQATLQTLLSGALKGFSALTKEERMSPGGVFIRRLIELFLSLQPDGCLNRRIQVSSLQRIHHYIDTSDYGSPWWGEGNELVRRLLNARTEYEESGKIPYHSTLMRDKSKFALILILGPKVIVADMLSVLTIRLMNYGVFF